MHPQKLLKKQKHLLIVLGILLAITGIYDIFYRSRVESGLIGLILAFFVPVAMYRGYFLGVGLLMFSLFLSHPLLRIPIFCIAIAYISIKEARKWLSMRE